MLTGQVSWMEMKTHFSARQRRIGYIMGSSVSWCALPYGFPFIRLAVDIDGHPMAASDMGFR
jgi:hypothetical protein